MKTNQERKYALLLIAGILFIGGGILVHWLVYDNSQPVILGALSGIGGAWIGISARKLYYYRKNPEVIKKEYVNEHDERNIAIRGRAANMSVIMTMVVLAVAELLLMLLDMKIAAVIVFVALLIHILSYFAFIVFWSKRI